jgi:hypothetical protein
MIVVVVVVVVVREGSSSHFALIGSYCYEKNTVER